MNALRISTWICWFAALACMSRVNANVTVRGTVKLWNSKTNQYQPASGVHVQVEGDWWWRINPDTHTDDSGVYSCVVEDPPATMPGGYNRVGTLVVAENIGLWRVFQKPEHFYPYSARSGQKNGVAANTTVTIDLFIGGSSNNTSSTGAATPTDVALALLVNAQLRTHHRWLVDRAASPSDFNRTIHVIWPAVVPVTDGAHYNHATSTIYLTASYYSWANPYAGNIAHEYSHAIHDMLSVPVPQGLNIPTNHSDGTETGPQVAYTEAWAQFLQAVTLGDSFYEPTNPAPPHAWLGFSYTDHAFVEGEVLGLLWDCHDGIGQEQIRSSHRNPLMHSNIPQTWNDRLTDASLDKIWNVVATERQLGNFYVPRTPWQVGEFIHVWRTTWPNDLHALKAAAYNRDITMNLPAETPPAISQPTVEQDMSGRVTLTVDVTELDAEDRPFVTLQLYSSNGSEFLTPISSATLSTWNGSVSRQSLKWTFPKELPAGMRYWLYVVAHDDMRYAFRKLEIKKTAYVHEPTGDDTPASLPLPSKGSIFEQAAKGYDDGAAKCSEIFGRFKDLASRQSALQEQALAVDHGLYRFAVERADIKPPSESVPFPKTLDDSSFKPTDAMIKSFDMYRAWAATAAAGQSPFQKPLDATELSVLAKSKAAHAACNKLFNEGTTKLASELAALQAAHKAFTVTPGGGMAARSLEASVKACSSSLAALSARNAITAERLNRVGSVLNFVK